MHAGVLLTVFSPLSHVFLSIQMALLPLNQCMSNLNMYAADRTIVVGEIKEGLYSVGI